MRVENIRGNSGAEVPNQFIIHDGDKVYFQSYRTIIVMRRDGKTYLDENYWDYSRTTGKYRNIFLGEDKKTTERKIKEGTYLLADLN
jgi:hypothetical protein